MRAFLPSHSSCCGSISSMSDNYGVIRVRVDVYNTCKHKAAVSILAILTVSILVKEFVRKRSVFAMLSTLTALYKNQSQL